MSKDKIKYEINRVLDHFSDNALEELLVFLRQLEQKEQGGIIHSDLLQHILSEDKDLLQKLAQ